MAVITHIVKRGECLSGIAKLYGYSDFKKIYDHPDNKDFKKKRPNPNIIYPGDIVIIPEKELNTIKKTSGSSSNIKVNRPKKIVRVKVTSLGKPYKNADAILFIDGDPYRLKDLEIKGLKTDNDGILETKIPYEYINSGATIADVVIEKEHFQLQLGGLDPISSISGIQQRLINLGYSISDPEGIITSSTENAISQFKVSNSLEENYEIDDAFRKKLLLIHDGDDTISEMESEDKDKINARNIIHQNQNSNVTDDSLEEESNEKVSSQYTIVKGDTLSGIAMRFGYSNYRDIYNHPDNADFKRKRPNPDLIYPGDVIALPGIESEVQDSEEMEIGDADFIDVVNNFLSSSYRRL